jgi:hypothetical protein
MDLPVDYTKLSHKERRDVREQYIKHQKGLCYWCKKDLGGDPPPSILDRGINLDMFPPGFLNHPVHLQHDHSTGMTQGAVHAYCNAVMWQYYMR